MAAISVTLGSTVPHDRVITSGSRMEALPGAMVSPPQLVAAKLPSTKVNESEMSLKEFLFIGVLIKSRHNLVPVNHSIEISTSSAIVLENCSKISQKQKSLTQPIWCARDSDDGLKLAYRLNDNVVETSLGDGVIWIIRCADSKHHSVGGLDVISDDKRLSDPCVGRARVERGIE